MPERSMSSWIFFGPMPPCLSSESRDEPLEGNPQAAAILVHDLPGIGACHRRELLLQDALDLGVLHP
eukprot:10652211-Lingulodinium_polyedra.AAC.1